MSDECLELLSCSFPNFKSLVLVSCEGFTTDGLAAIAANCRYGSDVGVGVGVGRIIFDVSCCECYLEDYCL